METKTTKKKQQYGRERNKNISENKNKNLTSIRKDIIE